MLRERGRKVELEEGLKIINRNTGSILKPGCAITLKTFLYACQYFTIWNFKEQLFYIYRKQSTNVTFF